MIKKGGTVVVGQDQGKLEETSTQNSPGSVKCLK